MLEGSADADAETDAETDGEAEVEPEGSAETAGTDGSGTGVGSAMKREGTPRIDRTKTSTKTPMTVKIQGRASWSSRVGSEPR